MFKPTPGWIPPMRIAPTDPWRCYKCGADASKLNIYGRAFRLEYARCTKCGQRHSRKMMPDVVKSGPRHEVEDRVEKKPVNMTITKVVKGVSTKSKNENVDTIKDTSLKPQPPIGGLEA